MTIQPFVGKRLYVLLMASLLISVYACTPLDDNTLIIRSGDSQAHTLSGLQVRVETGGMRRVLGSIGQATTGADEDDVEEVLSAVDIDFETSIYLTTRSGSTRKILLEHGQMPPFIYQDCKKSYRLELVRCKQEDKYGKQLELTFNVQTVRQSSAAR